MKRVFLYMLLVNIVAAFAIEVDINLSQGWNLIAIPCSTGFDEITDILPIVPPAYAFSQDEGYIGIMAFPRPSQSFWVLSLVDTVVRISCNCVDDTPSDTGFHTLIWLYFCLVDSYAFYYSGDTFCAYPYGNWFGDEYHDSICNNFVFKIWALDSSQDWRSTEIYNCSIPGFEAIAFGVDETSHLWLCMFDKLNTYSDGSPWTEGFRVGDSLKATISVHNPDSIFHHWSTDTIGWQWAEDPMGDVYLMMHLFPRWH